MQVLFFVVALIIGLHAQAYSADKETKAKGFGANDASRTVVSKDVEIDGISFSHAGVRWNGEKNPIPFVDFMETYPPGQGGERSDKLGAISAQLLQLEGLKGTLRGRVEGFLYFYSSFQNDRILDVVPEIYPLNKNPGRFTEDDQDRFLAILEKIRGFSVLDIEEKKG